MNKLWLIMKNEFVYTVTRRSFLFTLFVLPLIAFAVGWFSTMGTRQESSAVQAITGPVEPAKPEGLVDLSGLVNQVPGSLQEKFIQFSSRQEAEAAFEAEVAKLETAFARGAFKRLYTVAPFIVK